MEDHDELYAGREIKIRIFYFLRFMTKLKKLLTREVSNRLNLTSKSNKKYYFWCALSICIGKKKLHSLNIETYWGTRISYFNNKKFDKNGHIYCKKTYENHDGWEKIRGPVL